jgi:hypothetical protein
MVSLTEAVAEEGNGISWWVCLGKAAEKTFNSLNEKEIGT